MKISYNWLQELIIGKIPPPAKLAELFDLHSFEVESLEKTGSDYVFDIAILPNRAHDCLSHIGVAKEVAAICKLKVQSSKFKVKEDNKIKIGDFISIDIKDIKKCPFYATRVVLNAQVAPSPKWLRDRLEALGQKSINNIVDATNYVMFALGQPIHIFDLDKINGKKITVRLAGAGEKIEILGGEARELSKDDLVISDAEGALAIAGVKGGTKAEVTSETKNIVIEAAYFDPVSTRLTSKRLGLRTDASVRFENGFSPLLPEKALEQAAVLIAELSGGTAAKGAMLAGRAEPANQKIFFTPVEIEKILGVKIAEREMIDILKRLGFSTVKKGDGYVAVVPEERLDIFGSADIAEEIGRIFGLENILPILPEGVLIPATRNDEWVIAGKIKDAFCAAGFYEVCNRSFVGDKYLEISGSEKSQAVAISNPLSLDNKYLRSNLLIHLLDNAAENLKHTKRVRLFELGTVFASTDGDKVSERQMLSGVIANREKSARSGIEFYEAKGAIDSLLEKLGLDDFWYDGYVPGKNSLWHSGRTAEIKVGERVIGIVGEINSRAAQAFGIVGRVVAFEISTEALIELAEEKAMYAPISKFPAVERDIAVLVPREVKVDDVESVIEIAGGELLVDSDLFDIYDEHLEAEPRLGKSPRRTAVCNQSQSSWTNRERKSLAFHLIFQSSERTLTDSEVNGIFEKIVKAIESEGWEVRK